MKKPPISQLLYICFLILIPDYVYANSGSVNQFEKALKSFEVEGLSLGMKEAEANVILSSAGYKLKVKKERKKITFYRYTQRKDKKPYQVLMYIPLKQDEIEALEITLPSLNSKQSLENAKQRILNVFNGYEKTCESRKTYIKCSNFTDTNKLFIEARLSNASIQYTLQDRPDSEAKFLAEQRAHSQTHKLNAEAEAIENRKQEAEKAAAAEAYQKEVRKISEQKREASHQRMLLKDKQQHEKMQKALKASAEREKQITDTYYKAYYEKTPEREKSKYSERERRMMKNGKLIVPDNYPAPDADEIRLAVMRSMVDRADLMNGYNNSERVRRTSIDSVVTNGKLIYLIIDRVGTQIKFWDVRDISCSKRAGHPGYMCQYLLGTSAENSGNNSLTRSMASYLSFSGNIKNTDWFMLTETGWRQPHTNEQLAELENNDDNASRLIQERRARRYDGASLLDTAAQEFNDGLYIEGVQAGAELRKLR